MNHQQTPTTMIITRIRQHSNYSPSLSLPSRTDSSTAQRDSSRVKSGRVTKKLNKIPKKKTPVCFAIYFLLYLQLLKDARVTVQRTSVFQPAKHRGEHNVLNK